MLNKCVFIGHVGREPEFKEGKVSIASLSLAVTEKYKNKAGEKVENTEWVNLVAFGPLTKVLGYVQKGDKIYIEAKYKLEKYQAKDGTEKQTPKFIIQNVVLLGSPKYKEGYKQDIQAPFQHQLDDNIPF